MKVIDFCYCEEKDRVCRMEEREFFEEGSFREYYSNMCVGSLDKIWFKFKDVDVDVFVYLDGGEMIRLKSGEYVNVCWRGSMCRVWLEDDEEFLEELEKYRKMEV